MKFQTGLNFATVYMKKSHREGRKIIVCNSLVKLCQFILKTNMAEKRSIYILNTLLPVDSSSTSITYNLVMSLINRRNFLVKNSHKQFFIKRMFVLKESKYRRNAWVFLSEHSRKSGIYFVFCVTEHLLRTICSVFK